MAASLILGPDESSLEIVHLNGNHAKVVQFTIDGEHSITVQLDDLLQALSQQNIVSTLSQNNYDLTRSRMSQIRTDYANKTSHQDDGGDEFWSGAEFGMARAIEILDGKG